MVSFQESLFLSLFTLLTQRMPCECVRRLDIMKRGGRMAWWLLATLLVCGPLCGTGFLEETGEHDFLFSAESEPIVVPLDITIMLLGFSGDGAFQYDDLEPDDLKFTLQESLSGCQPSSVESGKRFNIRYHLTYEIVEVDSVHLRLLEASLSRAMTRVDPQTLPPRDRKQQHYEVEVMEIEKHLDDIYISHFSDEGDSVQRQAPYSIIIINPEKRNMIPDTKKIPIPVEDWNEPDYVYYYRYRDGSPTQAWVSGRRYVVVDLSAGPCQYGNANAGEGTVSANTFPRLMSLMVPPKIEPKIQKESRGEGDDEGEDEDEDDVDNVLDHQAMIRNVEFRAQLSTIIMSAVRHLFAPDVRYDTVDFTEKLIVPIVVLKNHDFFNPLDQAHDFSIDLEQVETEVKRMLLPSQEVVFVTGAHSLLEHRHIAMAVAKAMRSDTVHEATEKGTYAAKTKPYLDSAILLEELRTSADVLAGGLIAAGSGLPFQGGYDDPQTRRSTQQSHGSRVLPVYVFSLLGYEDDLLLDQRSLMAVNKDSVIVLQTDAPKVPIPFSSLGRTVFLEPRSPTRDIIAGIATALGALVAPYEEYSTLQERVVEDYIWANGHHPFGPFSNCTSISTIFLDALIRNSILSRMNSAIAAVREAVDDLEVFAQEFIYNPLGVDEEEEGVVRTSWVNVFYHTSHASPLARNVLMRLHNDVSSLENQFLQAADMVYDFELEQANILSSSVLVTARAFLDYVRQELHKARTDMHCCSMRHEVRSSFLNFVVGGGMIAVAAGFFVIAVKLLESPRRPTGRRRQ